MRVGSGWGSRFRTRLETDLEPGRPRVVLHVEDHETGEAVTWALPRPHAAALAALLDHAASAILDHAATRSGESGGRLRPRKLEASFGGELEHRPPPRKENR